MITPSLWVSRVIINLIFITKIVYKTLPIEDYAKSAFKIFHLIFNLLGNQIKFLIKFLVKWWFFFLEKKTENWKRRGKQCAEEEYNVLNCLIINKD